MIIGVWWWGKESSSEDLALSLSWAQGRGNENIIHLYTTRITDNIVSETAGSWPHHGTMYRYWICQGIRISSTTRSNVLPCGVKNGSTYYVFCWRGSTYYITMTDDSDSDSDSESDGGDRFKEEDEIIISVTSQRYHMYWIDITLLSFAPDTRYKYLPSADFLSDRLMIPILRFFPWWEARRYSVHCTVSVRVVYLNGKLQRSGEGKETKHNILTECHI